MPGPFTFFAFLSIVLSFAYIVVFIVFIALTNTVWKSPRPEDNGATEWAACSKLLGPLAGVRLAFMMIYIYVQFKTVSLVSKL